MLKMNKFFIIAITLILDIQSAAAQDVKAKTLTKHDTIECTYRGIYMELDSICYDGEKLYLCNNKLAQGPSLNDTITVRGQDYVLILLQKKTVSKEKEGNVKDPPKIPKSLGLYYFRVKGSCTGMNTVAHWYDSAARDIVWLLPIANNNTFFAERMTPRKYRKKDKNFKRTDFE
jgi:hypothetical protein